MSTCMQCSQIIALPNGPTLLLQAVQIALRSARADIETECVEVHDLGYRWWDTENGLFSGGSDNDLEFAQMRRESVEFLEGMGKVISHPFHPDLVRFVDDFEIDTPAAVSTPEAAPADPVEPASA